MNILFEYWYVFVGVIAVAVLAGYSIALFVKLPKDEKIANVKNWLHYAVTEAEAKYKSGTGQLKLSYVYDLFVSKFPEIAKYIAFETFSQWVDDALIWLGNQLDSNPAIQNIVK